MLFLGACGLLPPDVTNMWFRRFTKDYATSEFAHNSQNGIAHGTAPKHYSFRTDSFSYRFFLNFLVKYHYKKHILVSSPCKITNDDVSFGGEETKEKEDIEVFF